MQLSKDSPQGKLKLANVINASFLQPQEYKTLAQTNKLPFNAFNTTCSIWGNLVTPNTPNVFQTKYSQIHSEWHRRYLVAPLQNKPILYWETPTYHLKMG